MCSDAIINAGSCYIDNFGVNLQLLVYSIYFAVIIGTIVALSKKVLNN